MFNRTATLATLIAAALISITAAQPRTEQLIDSDWRFALGHAADRGADFGNATEYFNYLTKASSIHNQGPYAPSFDTSGPRWRQVMLPHDWAVDLPFDSLASHSHGYKQLGWRWPGNSVGWYVRHISVDSAALHGRVALRFDGIFRNSTVWCNGFYLGGEPSGYATATYDITRYLTPGPDNVVTVRVDATDEEGWFYEGAGIYRHAWLETTGPVYILPGGLAVTAGMDGHVTVSADLANSTHIPAGVSLSCTLTDRRGHRVGSGKTSIRQVSAMGSATTDTVSFRVAKPKLWSPETPTLYTLTAEVTDADGRVTDRLTIPVGFRTVEFTSDNGMMLNGKRYPIRGVNLHQDHAGVGAAIPDGLAAWRIKRLKEMGVNTIRSSHNPMSPAMLGLCDSLGMLVVEENRLMGVNQYHRSQLERMIRRDRCHPSVIVWSVGNEEWALEWDRRGEGIVADMCAMAHAIDPTRPATAATSSGPCTVVTADVAGYNYVVQNPIDSLHGRYPYLPAFGSEETTGCGTRGIYRTDRRLGVMESLNRHKAGPDSMVNCISRGMRFYDARPWLGGLCFWTGFDYRGEPNPLEWPATGSQFGLLDYCGFPKDEAYYVRACWQDQPLVHLLPHWNIPAAPGDSVDVWVYTNCDEVELWLNNRSLGRRKAEPMQHLAWRVAYAPGNIEAIGYRNGKHVADDRSETSGPVAKVLVSVDTEGQLDIVTLRAIDRLGRFVADACADVTVSVGPGDEIIGFGNGDPAWRRAEKPGMETSDEAVVPLFNGMAQVLVRRRSPEGHRLRAALL